MHVCVCIVCYILVVEYRVNQDWQPVLPVVCWGIENVSSTNGLEHDLIHKSGLWSKFAVSVGLVMRWQ